MASHLHLQSSVPFCNQRENNNCKLILKALCHKLYLHSYVGPAQVCTPKKVVLMSITWPYHILSQISGFYAGETSNRTVVEGCVDFNGEKKHVSSLLKDLQPCRQRPSKDRAKQFAAGDIPSDQPVPAHHDLQEF